MMRRRSVRRAQAISPFGPGSVLDIGEESFVVLDTQRNRRAWDRKEQKITLDRLLPGKARDGFRLPPKLDVFSKKDVPALLIQRFPAWLFCPRCRRMYRVSPEVEEGLNNNKPTCRQCKGSALVPMRYVAACPDGHLSDVDWWRWAHSQKKGASGQCSPMNPRLLFKSDSDSGSMNKSLSIECARCGASRTLKDITTGSLRGLSGQRCSGRQPWQRKQDAVDCSEEPRALLRSQTALHFAEISSALDLQDTDTGVTDELNTWLSEEIKFLLQYGDPIPDPMKVKLARKASDKFDTEVDGAHVDRVIASLSGAGVRASSAPKAALNPLADEWFKLITPTPGDSRRAPLRVIGSDWNVGKEDSALARLIDSVMLVERLREVRALVGFRRLEPDATLVPPDLTGKQDWLPALEVFGEGIFVRLSNAAMAKWEASNGPALSARIKSIQDRLSQEGSWVVDRFSMNPTLLPRFIMLHTFSHLLMRQLSFECGYSGASLRERIYVLEEGCGVLIYTADADSEGSLGGLVRQGKKDRIEDTITSALVRSTWCSNDPICSEMPPHGPDRLNQAACHACALAPETSCTHLNLLLDRKLVIGGGGQGPVGFFDSIVSQYV